MPNEIAFTILLAMLTGALAFLGSVITRGNLISGFRQNWINDQRADLATISAKATVLSSNESKDWGKDVEAFAAAFSRIRLRENPLENEWTEVIDKITELHTELWNKKGAPHDVTALLKGIDLKAQKPLKENWSQTSKGEPAYRRGIATVIVVAVLVAVAFGILVAKGEDEDKPAAKSPASVVVNCAPLPSPPVKPQPDAAKCPAMPNINEALLPTVQDTGKSMPNAQ